MTRGNQREKSRAKASKQKSSQSKSAKSSDKEANKGLTLEARKTRDADIMRAKQSKKAA